jgi:uncharacterized membrane protein
MARMVTGCAWVLALLSAATTVTAQQAVVVQGIQCRGEEPFWSVDANRTTATFNSLAARGNREVIFRGAPQAFSYLKPMALVWRGDSTHLPRETLVIALREEACRSTMADGPASAWRALLSLKPGEALTGCCTVRAAYDPKAAPLADPGQKSADDWAHLLPDLLPAINLCLASDAGRAQWIARASQNGHGSTMVRIVETSGSVVDCEADSTGKGSAKITPATASDAPAAGPGQPLFYPARDPPPMVSCGRLERVGGRSGATAGYLHYDPC